jgi:putative ABC transport system substrate-binding protein
MGGELGAKRLEFLHELVPAAGRFAAILARASPSFEFYKADLEAASTAIGGKTEIFRAGSNREIDAAFAALVQRKAEALLIYPGPIFNNRRVQIVTLAAHHRLPAIYTDRAFAEAGGLMSYGSSVTDQTRLVGFYTGRILKGEKPAEMPIIRADKFELILNLQTASTLGIRVPATLLARADEVIE